MSEKRKWNDARAVLPENEDTVEVQTKSGRILNAWWKGVGWKCGSGVWVDNVVRWRSSNRLNS
jgi:hypothetical protein